MGGAVRKCIRPSVTFRPDARLPGGVENDRRAVGGRRAEETAAEGHGRWVGGGPRGEPEAGETWTAVAAASVPGPLDRASLAAAGGPTSQGWWPRLKLTGAGPALATARARAGRVRLCRPRRAQRSPAARPHGPASKFGKVSGSSAQRCYGDLLPLNDDSPGPTKSLDPTPKT